MNQVNRNRPLLELKRLNVRFRHHEVLRDISISVHRGETLAIIGESGCGKTVLLKHMNGLRHPNTGQVRFDGQDLATLSDHELSQVRTRFGYVFQQAALFDSLTVGQNVAFPLHQQRDLNKNEIRDQVTARLQEVGLPASIIHKRPTELSGGMRKRVGIARALILEPEMMLYDEPTTGLDPIMSDVINELMIQARARSNVTSVLVTHDMKSALKVADRIIMLYPLARLRPSETQIVFDGSPDQIQIESDPCVAQFVKGEARDRLAVG